MAGKDDWIDDVRRWCFDGGRAAEPAAHGGLAAPRAGMPPAESAAVHAATIPGGPWPSSDDAMDVHDRRHAAAGFARSAS